MFKKNPVENEYVRFDKLSALVIDDISAMRHAIRLQMHTLGTNTVSMASGALEALELLKITNFDLILCDYNLNKSSSGQHFLEHLRNEKLLRATTIFVMLTAETEYSFVANAVEFSPDDYLLKPCSESKLRSRLVRLIDRRSFMMPVLNAINEGKYDDAVYECDRLLGAKDDRYVMDVLRRKSEAQFAMQDYNQALETFTEADGIRPDVPWVMMGLARCHYALGDLNQAAELTDKLIVKNKNYVAAYELRAAILQDSDDEAGAFKLLKNVSEIMPSAKRFRSVSEAAFLLGDMTQAKGSIEAALRLSNGSMVEQSGDYLSLAQTQVDMGDARSAIMTLEKNAKKYGEVGMFGVAKDAILAQAYFDTGDTEKAKRLIERSTSLLANRQNSFVMTALGKAALKLGDDILGMKLLTQAVQVSGNGEKRIARFVRKSMHDTGYDKNIEDLIDGGRKRILVLVEEASRLMRVAHFEEAYRKVTDALDIHAENLEALMAAAQLHLLWLKHSGVDTEVRSRAKGYLSTLDRLLPNNPKVLNFYRFFNEIVG